MIAPARLARILQPCKARCQALDHAARPRLHRTGNGKQVPQSTARPKLMREPCGGQVFALCNAVQLPALPAGSPLWPPPAPPTPSGMTEAMIASAHRAGEDMRNIGLGSDTRWRLNGNRRVVGCPDQLDLVNVSEQAIAMAFLSRFQVKPRLV